MGSFGNGTVLRDSTEVELVAFLSCFRSFRETEDLDNMLDQLSKTLCSCQGLLAFDLKDVWLVEEVFCAIAFTIWTKNLEGPITFTIMPAYRDLGKGRGTPPNSYGWPPPSSSLLLCGHMQTHPFFWSTHVPCWVLGNCSAWV